MKTASIIVTNTLLEDMGHNIRRLDASLLHDAMMFPANITITGFESVAPYEQTRVKLSGDGLPDGCEGQDIYAGYSRVEISKGKFGTVFDGFKIPPDVGSPKFVRSVKTGKCFWCKRSKNEHSPNDYFCPIPVQPLAE